MPFYIVILHNLIYSTEILYSISSGTEKESSARKEHYFISFFFVTGNRVITVLVYTLINLGINI